ncbi:lactate permease [Enemella dayhoffiae]|uniref:L-lactate permease n=1 Tax=Enemella dayhoffiae TaxID=2016507 RepID=A0A255HDQ9_9ACTN|nr:L-lactate permease [Enemella dayhoffiae]OYO25183.1 lactate permease [Enemella dayhoffiae]
MTSLLAALPLLVAILGLALRLRALTASLLSVAVAVLLALTVFRTPAAAWYAGLAGLTPTVLEVLGVLFGGVLLNLVLNRTGAQTVIAAWVERSCAGQRERAGLFMALGLTPFAESVTGYGLGAMIAIPLLRHLGFDRTRALTLGLLGLFLTTWGALAPGALVAAALGGVDVIALSVRSAELAIVAIVLTGLTAQVLALGRRALRLTPLLDLLLMSAATWGVLIATNRLLGPPLAGVLGSLAATLVMLLRFRLAGARPGLDRVTARALLPYGVLVAGLLGCGVALRLTGATGAWTLLGHGSLWLLVTCTVTLLRERTPLPQVRQDLTAALLRWWPVGSATAGFLFLGAVLTLTGMSGQVAVGLSAAGAAYAFLSPFVGGLGGLVSGTAVGANAMFAASQAEAAVRLGIPALELVSVQNLTAGVLTMAAPTRVALALVPAAATSDTDDPADRLRTEVSLRWLIGLCLVILTCLGLLELALLLTR